MADFGRRAFLSTLAAAVAGSVLDPDRLLWVPGRTRYFVMPSSPFASGWATDSDFLMPGDIVTIEGIWQPFVVMDSTTDSPHG